MALHLDQMIIGAREADVARGGANNAGRSVVAAVLHKVEIPHGHSRGAGSAGECEAQSRC